MRFCGTFCGISDVARTENRSQLHRFAGQSGAAALFAVDDADRRPHRQAGFTQCCDRIEQRSSGGDHVLHEAHALSFFVGAFEAIRGAVLLGRLAHDHERQTGGEGAGGGKRDRPELGPGEPSGLRLELRHGRRDPLAECAEQVRPRLEAVFVEVVPGALARTKEEVAFEIGVLAQRERADLYFEDGSMLSLTNGSPGADRLLPLAREILGKTRGT